MFSSRRAKLSNADTNPGQSLFDFLRRKKRVSLQDSLGHSRKQSNQMSFSNIDIKQQGQGDERDTSRTQTNRKPVTSAVTPKKVTFAQSQQKNRQTARTFIDMISPLKQKPSKILQNDSIEQQQQNSKSILISGKKKNNSTTLHSHSHSSSQIHQQQFNRKQFNKSLQVMMDTIRKLIQTGKTLKQKSHSLFIDMKPVFKIAQENENKIIKRKVEDAKQKLRTMEHLFGELDIENENQILETFQRTLSEHLVSIQAKNKSNFEKIELESSTRIRNEKDAKISELTFENKSLQQSINILEKKIEKLEFSLQQNKEKQQQKLENYQQNHQQRYDRLEQKVGCLQQQKQVLKQKIAHLQRENAEKQKRVKDAVYAKQTTQKRLCEQNIKAKSARQQFLLNQISQLKSEFQHDITQLTTLYNMKQQDQSRIIEQLRCQLKQIKQHTECNKENERKIVSDAQTMKGLVNKYRKQNQCLVTDMHRMNQELYQHWLALKDVKTLATRLHLLPKFARIFEDLGFNDLLFS